MSHPHHTFLVLAPQCLYTQQSGEPEPRKPSEDVWWGLEIARVGLDKWLALAASGEGVVERPGLVIHLRETAVFCKMLTSRLNLPIALISGNMKLHGDLRRFLRMNTLFSVDAKPRGISAL